MIVTVDLTIKNKVFIQLYSIVRQERGGHLDVFRALSGIGYDGIELLGNNTNGLSFYEYRRLMQDLNLRVFSSHNLHSKADYDFAAGLGAKYAVLSGCDDLRNRDELARICDQWNETGRTLAKFGLKGVIHNHGEEV